MRYSLSQFFRSAPLIVGAFFLTLSLSACKEASSRTDTWISSELITETNEAEAPPSEVQAEAEAPQQVVATSGEEVRFLSYNLENYLTMRRGKEYLPKPQKEIDAVVALIARQKPDILGVCEIGKKKDLDDLQRRLKNAGIDLPFSEHTGGRDKTRHLGLLSKYPIIATDSQTDSSYEMEGREWVISRGILDVTVDIKGTPLRMLGVHLKSKRPIDEADQQLIRENEARLLRDHADEILNEDLETLLLAYGDFNDTIGSKTLSIARGRRNAKRHMPDFYFKDSRGELWTHFWDYQDIYSRFDYVLFSSSLREKIVGKKSYIVDDPAWANASDHRPLMLVLKP